MKVLIIGSGGREHAIAWRCAQSEQVQQVFVAPGNAGTAGEPKTINIDIAADAIDALLAFATDNTIDLTIVGPEQPLVAGIVDRFASAGLRCFGPSQQAAQLEGSKAFTKAFLQRHGIPTAAYATFSEADAACAYVRSQRLPVVIKADGLAAGKGVVIAETLDTALTTIADMLNEGRFGAAGAEIVIEEFLPGEEASFIVMTDGYHVLPMATSQDHKARDNGDRGPNTGGMGAYSPAPVVTPAVTEHVMQDIIKPTIDGLAADGIRYRGFLYAGLMIDQQGNARVLEFNCRLGDPETQPLMCRLTSDLPALCQAVVDGTLSEHEASWTEQAALGVVLAADGYPEHYDKHLPLRDFSTLDPQHDVKTFHAGTTVHEGELVSDGGRVVCITALGDSVSAAAERAYSAVAGMRSEGLFHRDDIGYRAIDRERQARS
ncbi:MAG: phosphoribosylamine--glycine ligase [Pseudomonadota bacterium]